jgi:hypothetical protein
MGAKSSASAPIPQGAQTKFARRYRHRFTPMDIDDALRFLRMRTAFMDTYLLFEVEGPSKETLIVIPLTLRVSIADQPPRTRKRPLAFQYSYLSTCDSTSLPLSSCVWNL